MQWASKTSANILIPYFLNITMANGVVIHTISDTENTPLLIVNEIPARLFINSLLFKILSDDLVLRDDEP